MSTIAWATYSIGPRVGKLLALRSDTPMTCMVAIGDAPGIAYNSMCFIERCFVTYIICIIYLSLEMVSL